MVASPALFPVVPARLELEGLSVGIEGKRLLWLVLARLAVRGISGCQRATSKRSLNAQGPSGSGSSPIGRQLQVEALNALVTSRPTIVDPCQPATNRMLREDDTKGAPVNDYMVKPLLPDTWDAFPRLVERHNSMFGGCWCTWFHTIHFKKLHRGATARSRRGWSRRVAHTLRWCSTAMRRSPGASTAPARNCRTSTTARRTRPRSTGRPTTGSPAFRGQEVPAQRIDGGRTSRRTRSDRAGRGWGCGGVPADTGGKKVSVLYNGTRSLFERAGSSYLRAKGTKELRDAHDRQADRVAAASSARTKKPFSRPSSAR